VLYWDLGKLIAERLANDLQNEFPGIGGFSASNLWCTKGFCEAYADYPKLAPLVREIGWSHNIVMMERCHDPIGGSNSNYGMEFCLAHAISTLCK